MPPFIKVVTILLCMFAASTLLIALVAPETETAKTIINAQGLIAGIITGAAAVITVYVIYLTAELPIKHQKQQEGLVRLEKERIGAAILFLETLAYYTEVHQELKKIGRDDAVVLVPVPTALKDLEILRSQNIEMTKRLGSFVTKLSHFNWLMSLDDVSLHKMFNNPGEKLEEMGKDNQDEMAALRTALKEIVEQP